MSKRRRHEGNREDPTPSKCIGVSGLSLYTSERELEQESKKFCPLEKVQVVLDGHSGRSSKCIGVSGMSLYTSKRELEQGFKKFGPLEKVQVVLDGH